MLVSKTSVLKPITPSLQFFNFEKIGFCFFPVTETSSWSSMKSKTHENEVCLQAIFSYGWWLSFHSVSSCLTHSISTTHLFWMVFRENKERREKSFFGNFLNMIWDACLDLMSIWLGFDSSTVIITVVMLNLSRFLTEWIILYSLHPKAEPYRSVCILH